MFEIKEKQSIQIRVYGVDYTLARPTYAAVESFQQKLQEAGDAGSLAVTKGFIEGLGMPGQAIADMQIDHFKELVEHIMGGSVGKKSSASGG